VQNSGETYGNPNERDARDGRAGEGLSRLQEQLLDPGVWRPVLQRYAAATTLAVALTDTRGKILGECINPRPLWTLLRARVPAAPGDCPFCIRSIRPEQCSNRVGADGSRALSGGYAGLVHFAVPLRAAGDLIGYLLAGQVQNKYPEQLQLHEVGKDVGLPERLLLETARAEVPISEKTLHVYWDLLESFADSFLNTHLHRFLEKQRLAEMAEIDRRKDEFLATLSHELRTPLTSILGWIRHLRGKQVDNATLQTALEVIDRNAAMQAHLVDDLLQVSRIITGKIQLDVERTDLVSVVNAAVNSVRPSAEIKKIAFQVALDTGARFVMGDFARLQQVVWNLLTNSVKFTPPNGRIEVRLERIDSSARIMVSDTGEGIKKEFLVAMFDRFTQADSSRTRHHGGLGLGLAIVRQLVELHGGTVSANSAGEGKGTTMYVTLPLAPADASFAEQGSFQITTRPRRDANLNGLRALVVDDEKDTRDVLKEILEKEGVAVVGTESVGSALCILGHERFDIVITDIAMPGADGYDLIAAIRQMSADRGGSTPAVALTAFAHESDRRRLLAAGFQAHVAKPFTPNDLRAVIGDVLLKDRRRAS